jgi:hypothetical protein
MSKQQQSARDAAIDTRKLINALTERLEAVKEGLAEEDASPTRNQAVVAYCDGQIYQIEYLLSDINFGCYDAAKGESVTVKAEPPDLKSILLEIVCNYPEAIEQIKAMENVTAAHYGLAYGVTPALFVSHGYDGVQDRVRLQEKPDPAESTATWKGVDADEFLDELRREACSRCDGTGCEPVITHGQEIFLPCESDAHKPAQQPEPSEVCETDFEDAEAIAKFFHYTYERLAPDFGYETRPDTKQFDAESPNGKLMIAVCGEFLAGIRKPATPPASEPSRDAVIEAAAKFAEGCDMQN